MNEESHEENHVPHKVFKCPEIVIKINNATAHALIDSGSTISCISEQWFKENIPLLKPFEELPVSNTVIRTATGNTSRRIASTVYMPITIEKQTIHIQLLVVPNLIRPIIFGTDILSLMEMIINYNASTIEIKINNNPLMVKFERIDEDGQICVITTDECLRRNNNDIYNNDIYGNDENNMYEECYDNVCEEEGFQHDEDMTTDCLTEETIASTLKDNNYITEQQKDTLTNLILQYKERTYMDHTTFLH